MVATLPIRTLTHLPTFRRITDLDVARLQRLTTAFPPYSDHQAFGLLCWNTDDDGEYAIVNGNLAFKLREYNGDGYFLTFVGTRDVVKTVRQLHRFADAHHDINPILQRIPECVVRHTSGLRDLYRVAPAPDDFDYVFSVAEMTALDGSTYAEKRNAIRRLYAETQPELRQIDPRDRTAQTLMLDLFDRWADAKGLVNAAETLNERRALERFCVLSQSHGDAIITLGLFTGAGTMIGFCAAEVLTHGYALGHFEKADPDWSGGSALMRQRIAAYVQARGCRYLNAEQDLGDQGLRVSKRSWSPRFYLRKFTIAS